MGIWIEGEGRLLGVVRDCLGSEIAHLVNMDHKSKIASLRVS